MRIVLAQKYFYRGGGTATYLLALVEELKRRGHECIPFTVGYEQTVSKEYWDYYVSPPAGDDTTHLRNMRLSPWQMMKLLGRATWSTEAYRKALKLVDDTKPDIAYVLNIYSYMSPSPISAFRKRGLPVVMRVADYNMVCPELHLFRSGRPCEECLDHGLFRALRYRCHKGSLASTAARVFAMTFHNLVRAYDAVDRFIIPAAYMRDLLVRGGYDSAKIQHIPSFYEGSAAAAQSTPDTQYILYFGRLAPEKRLDILVRAQSLIPDAPPLWLAGGDVDGEQARLQALSESCGATVRFLGHQDREQLDSLIANALFTVVPSNCYDNCPMSVLESFAHGKPVIGSAIGGIPEQIAGDSGLLFEPGSAESLTVQMEALLADPARRERMGEAARLRLQTVFNPARHCDALLEAFDQVIAAKRAKRNAIHDPT